MSNLSNTENTNLTKKINTDNIKSIRRQIHQKQGSNPFYGTVNDAESIVTDMDHFPYTRFFRGVYYSPDPVVFEREAGWRPTRDGCYKSSCDVKNKYPNNCFAGSCTTVYPCKPKSLHKYSDRNTQDCIVLYR